MIRRKQIKVICSILAFSLIFTGCSKKQIFKHADEKYELKEVSDSELEEDIYYVKDTSKFYATYSPEGTSTSNTQIASAGRLLWTGKEDSLIPTMYEDGLIAYQSSAETNIEEASIERYEKLGDSIGVYGAEIDTNGYIYFKAAKIVKESSLAKALEGEKADGFTITEINGEPVTKDMLTAGGVITGFKYGKDYQISLYSGTYYKTISVTSDLHFYRSFEMYKTKEIITTKNGYLAINMPKDINSGFYYVQNTGLFKYYNTTKDNVTADIDINEPYYKTEAEQISSYSQQYVVNIAQPTYDVEFRASYDAKVVNDDEVVAILTAPDGTCYNMAVLGGNIGISLEEAMAGRWTINIVPQNLEITNIEAVSTATGDDATVETYTYELEEGSNKVFKAVYRGDGEVWGTVTYQDGTAYEFEAVDEKEEKYIAANLTYVGAGTYTVKIYHYADTVVEEPTIIDDESALSDINIVVESD